MNTFKTVAFAALFGATLTAATAAEAMDARFKNPAAAGFQTVTRTVDAVTTSNRLARYESEKMRLDEARSRRDGFVNGSSFSYQVDQRGHFGETAGGLSRNLAAR